MSFNSGSINGFSVNGAPSVAAVVICASFDQSWEVAVLPSENASFDQSWEVQQLPVENASFDQSWAVTITVSAPFTWNLGLVVDLESIIEVGLATDLGFEIILADTVEEDFEAIYDLKAPLAEDFEIVYNIKDTDTVDAPAEFPAPLIVDSEFEIVYSLREVVQEDFDFPTRLLVDADAPFEIVYDIKNTETVTSPFTILYSLLDESALNITGAIELEIVATGELIEVLEGEVSIDEGGYNWVGSITLAEVGDGDKFDFDDEVIVRIFGDEYHMVVDSKVISRDRPAQATANLTLSGKSARFDVPRAQAFTQNFDTAIAAKTAVETILGTTIDWQLIDWTIPGGRLGGDAVSPMKLAQQVAQAAGGLIESNIDGTLYARNLWPVPVSQLQSTTPDDTILEQDAILSLSEAFDNQIIFNKFRITDESATSFRDRLVFEKSDASGLTGCLFVFPAPFRDVVVEHTSDTQISLIEVGEEFQTKEEVVEFREGQGSVGFPIFDILSVEWMDDDLGPLTFTQYETTVFTTAGLGDPEGFSLATVTYRARAIKYDTSSTVDDSVQFLVVDC